MATGRLIQNKFDRVVNLNSDLSLDPFVNHQTFQVGDKVWTRYLLDEMIPGFVFSMSKIDELNLDKFRAYGYPNAQLGDVVLNLAESMSDTHARISVLPRWQQVLNFTNQDQKRNLDASKPADPVCV